MNPIYVVRHRITFGDLLIGGLVGWVLFLGIFSGDSMQLFLGLGFVIFLAFTRHKRYELTPTHLVIRFLGPRQSVIPLTEITGADLVKMPMSGTALMVVRDRGRRVMLTPTNSEGLLQELRAVMDR